MDILAQVVCYSEDVKTIFANWKSHKSVEEGQAWFKTFSAGYPMAKSPETQVVIAPPTVMLPVMNWALEQAKLPNLMLGTQDISPFPEGAYTGAISTKNLEGLNIAMTLVGHSERRTYFHETNQEVANKVELALQAEIKPVVCVDSDYLDSQMAAIPEAFWPQLVVAYEPVAAIGSGNQEPVEKVIPIVETIRSKYKPSAVWYGGSVSAGSIVSYLNICDGVIVATHSLDANDFLSVLRAE